MRLVDGKIIGDTFKDGRPDTFNLQEAVKATPEGFSHMRTAGAP